MSLRILAFFLLFTLGPLAAVMVRAQSSIAPDTVRQTIDRLIAKHGAAEADRIKLGVEQAARRWWAEDGDAAAFTAFCDANFLADPAAVAAAFRRLEAAMEQVDGHLYEARREVLTPLDLDTGPISPVDALLGDLDLAPHVEDDLFRTKVAFLALLNFPVHTLAERIAQGAGWDRETWARSRMMDRFALRVPAAVLQEGTRAYTEADQYIAKYNIRMGRLVTPEGQRPFPDDLRLIAHWGLRDELAAHYEDGAAGLARQRTILKVMERIVRQEIPAAVIDNPDLLWDPFANRVQPLDKSKTFDAAALARREPDVRYERLLGLFHAAQKVDSFSPEEPTFLARRFGSDFQVPEKEVEALLVAVLESPEVKDLARLIAKRVGRPLEPFDIWYSGFKSRGRYGEADLDRIVKAKYPTVAAFQADLPRIFQGLGFTAEKAAWLAQHVVVDPSRGAGHAMPAVRREDKVHLRTRIPAGGMDYKGYNIAIHELGHNTEQVFSLNGIDHWWLSGVPNNAFTEALAFVFQNRDLELLGLERPPDAAATEALATLWNTYEIGGVSLVDMRVWHWLYDHPRATPAELREAVLAIARDVWNRFYAPVLGVRDSEILAIYSHMIYYALYLPNYAIGHLIAFQVADKVQGNAFGAEFERVARQGRLTPDAWMRGAVGGPISARSLLAAARKALAAAGR
jgi:hypothetical protein